MSPVYYKETLLNLFVESRPDTETGKREKAWAEKELRRLRERKENAKRRKLVEVV